MDIRDAKPGEIWMVTTPDGVFAVWEIEQEGVVCLGNWKPNQGYGLLDHSYTYSSLEEFLKVVLASGYHDLNRNWLRLKGV